VESLVPIIGTHIRMQLLGQQKLLPLQLLIYPLIVKRNVLKQCEHAMLPAYAGAVIS
jgi:hypothetical protein